MKCDGCEWLEIEPPVNRYDNWRACCCDPDKPMHGARRVVSTAPAGSERGPVGIQTPVWCGRGTTPQSLSDSSPCTGELKRKGLKNRRGADDTATARNEI